MKIKPSHLRQHMLRWLMISSIVVLLFVTISAQPPTQLTLGVPQEDSEPEPPRSYGMAVICNKGGTCISRQVKKLKFYKTHTRFYDMDEEGWRSTTMEVWLEEGNTPSPTDPLKSGVIPDTEEQIH